MNTRAAFLSTGILSPWVMTSLPMGRSIGRVGRRDVTPQRIGAKVPLLKTRRQAATTRRRGLTTRAATEGLAIDLRGKKAFIAGIADDQGFGWAIAKVLCTAGADVSIGVWVPALKIFEMSLRRGKFDEGRRLPDGSLMEFSRIYPMDAVYDTPEDVPAEVAENKRYAASDGYTISEVAERVHADSGSIDILIHSLANGPEVTKPLLETSRTVHTLHLMWQGKGFGPLMSPGAAALSLSYVAAAQVVPGYGGGMSSAKAALESDTRVLAYEAGQKYNIRVNSISAGPLGSRAAKAIGFIDMIIAYSHANAPIKKELHAEEVGHTACFLCSPLASAITGQVIYVDNGLNIMSLALDSEIVQKEAKEKGLA